MSNDIQKADQIAFHFYTKLFYTVSDARATEAQRAASCKVDKWFNLETPDSDLFTKEAREPYRNVSQAPAASGPAPFEIQVLLSVPELTNNQVLVCMSPDSSFRVRIEPTPKFIVLETWTLDCAPHLDDQFMYSNNADVALPIIYKHGIVLFRSVFSILRILPAWKFFKRLRRKTSGMNRNGNFAIQLRTRPLSSSVEPSQTEFLEFHHPPSPIHRQPFPTSTRTFPPIPHILGVLTLSTTYLDNPNFQLDELESLLSSRFISLDREEFVPTLEKNRRRDSLIGSSLPSSSGSKSIASSRSPPMQIARATSTGGGGGLPGMSVAERFILPSSIGTSASTGSSALIPPPRPFPTMNPSPTTSPSGLALNRLRKESMNSSSSSSLASMRENVAGGGTSSPLSSSPSSGPVPIRKPSIFKANTVSSASGSSPSLSIRQGGGGGGGGGPSSFTRDNPAVVPSSMASGGSGHSRQQSFHSPVPIAARLPPSPIGTWAPISGSPPSSLGDRRSGTTTSGASFDVRERRVSSSSNNNGFAAAAMDQEDGVVPSTTTTSIPTRKRYSSSFGHRYSASGSSSSGAVGATPAAGDESSVAPSSPVRGSTTTTTTTTTAPSYLGAAADYDEISDFVQEIDSRKPLIGRAKQLGKNQVDADLGHHDRDRRRHLQMEEAPPPPSSSSSSSDEAYRNRFTDAPPSAATTTTTTSPLHRSLSVPNETETEQQQQQQQQLTTTRMEAEGSSTSPPRGLMLTSQGEVDERLTRMKAVFLRSIEGLGSGNGSSRRKGGLDGSPTAAAAAVTATATTTTTTATATATAAASKASHAVVATPRERGGGGSTPGGISSSSSNSARSAPTRLDPLASRGMNLGLPASPSRGPPPPPYAYNNNNNNNSSSSTHLGSSSGGGGGGVGGGGTASRGLEEVIGRMDLYEERRRSSNNGYGGGGG